MSPTASFIEKIHWLVIFLKQKDDKSSHGPSTQKGKLSSPLIGKAFEISSKGAIDIFLNGHNIIPFKSCFALLHFIRQRNFFIQHFFELRDHLAVFGISRDVDVFLRIFLPIVEHGFPVEIAGEDIALGDHGVSLRKRTDEPLKFN